MDEAKRGLRVRLGRDLRHIQVQHVRLREIQGEIDRALGSGSVNEVAIWTARLSDALRAHFELEQDHFFPTLVALDASTRVHVEQLAEEHVWFLEHIQTGIGGARGLDATRREISALRQRLSDHEALEERLLAGILSPA